MRRDGQWEVVSGKWRGSMWLVARGMWKKMGWDVAFLRPLDSSTLGHPAGVSA